MTLTALSTKIETIVAGITGAVFMRATDNDANISIDNVDLEGKTVCIFNNLPLVSNQVSKSGHIVEEWPVEIRVLQLSNLDDTTAQGDSIRDACAIAANTIWDKISFDQSLPDAFEYELNYLNEVKVYDKTLTGVRLAFVFNSFRGTYYC